MARKCRSKTKRDGAVSSSSGSCWTKARRDMQSRVQGGSAGGGILVVPMGDDDTAAKQQREDAVVTAAAARRTTKNYKSE